MTGTMHIGELAERTGVSLRTLRHYDEIGLVTASGRTEGGFRLYTPDDYDRLMLIRRMKPLGYSLEQMRELLELVESPASSDARAERIAGFIAETRERRRGLVEQLAMADEFLQVLEARAARG
ncbi:MAG TPA: MerR family transcriptional regulator [Pseudolysinimonas sp.]|jgi:DNA-binding transcriptional MerR regulator|nr:MerR family transcriptional regulator [Pseudolysinimonas sp.]